MPDTRRMRVALVGTFATVIGAITSVAVALVASVHGPLRTLETIANDHARAVQLSTRIRSSMSTARRSVVAELSRVPAGSPRGEASALYAALPDSVRELSLLANTPFEAEKLERLQAALRRCAAEAETIEELVASGDREGARDRLGAFLEMTGEANEAVDAIVGYNAMQVERSSRRVQRSIGIVVLAMLGLSGAAGAGSYVLLRSALRGLAAHEAQWHARFTDVDAFAARAAHELRTPLQTLKLALGSPTPGALERARRSTDRMSGTIDALLEFSRAGTAPVAGASADVRATMAEVQEELAPAIDQHRASVRIEVEPAAVAMAPEHLRTVLRNLLGNALRYGARPSGGRIGVRAAVQGRWMTLEVEDDGPGISPSALPHVFEPFARGTDVPGGYGVGLATVRRLVEGHRGTVAVYSSLGCGTTVRIALPVAAAAAVPDERTLLAAMR